MGQVIQLAHYRNIRNKGALNKIKDLEKQLDSLQRTLRYSHSVYARENAAIEMGRIQIEIMDLRHKMGVS